MRWTTSQAFSSSTTGVAGTCRRDESAVGLGPAKGKDSGSSLGPWLVTPDEMAPFLRDSRLHIKCSVRVNGDDWLTNAEGGESWHTWGSLIERASRDSRIAVGDVLGSGTVGGGSIAEAIRKGYEKARFLQPGDVVEHEAEGIGVLRNTIGPKVRTRTRTTVTVPGSSLLSPRWGWREDYRYPGRNR